MTPDMIGHESDVYLFMQDAKICWIHIPTWEVQKNLLCPCNLGHDYSNVAPCMSVLKWENFE